MKEQFCSYETSLLLKQCGFHETIRHYYAEGQPEPTPFKFDNGWEGYDDWNSQKDMTTEFGLVVASAPTQALAMRWLREEFHIAIDLLQSRDQGNWRSEWHVMAPDCQSSDYEYFPTYEEAAEHAIKAACRYILDRIRTRQDTMDAFACTCYIMQKQKEQC